ncbi:hypothetical protein [Terrimicrobium sacchariphilum]|nr:hypothetical protein [Terrimicrobium sacchariphilum]
MFIQTIGQLNKRGSVSELDEALARAVQQVRITGKTAELTYKLKIRPQDMDGDTVQIEDSITLKTANPIRKSALFFTTEDGRVSRDDPNQGDLAFEEVEGGKTEAGQQAPPIAAAQ